jgi:hypothetical protein
MRHLATLVRLHLKYCERCGSLWLRPNTTATPYCPACERIMAELPLRTRRPDRKIVPPTRAPAAPAQLPTAADFGQCVSVGVV